MSSQGIAVLTGTFSGTGQSTTQVLWGVFNLFIYGTFSGSVQLERSWDTGVTWVPVSASQLGTTAAYTYPISLSFQEIEPGMLYRLNCTSFSSGPIQYRIAVGPYRLRF